MEACGEDGDPKALVMGLLNDFPYLGMEEGLPPVRVR
jgi:hypothetical protein